MSGEVEDWHELGLIVPYFREVGFPQDPDYGRRPKKINAVLGLWDAPPHRDWLAWWTVGWTVLAGVAIATTPDDARTSSLPTWLDALLAAVVFGVLFGVFPAYLRLLVRRWRFRRARRTGHRSVSSEARESTANVLPRSEATPGPLSQPPVAAPTGPADAQPGSVDEQSRGISAPKLASPTPVDDSRISQTASIRSSSSRKQTTHAAGASGRAGAAPAGPSSIDALDLSQVRASEALSRARSDMPYPVARAARAIQGATSLRDVYEGLLRGAEALSVVLGVVSVVWARRYDVRTPQLEDLGTAIRGGGVSQGHWIQAAASVEREVARHPQPLAGLAEALKKGRGGSGLVADLTTLVQERNRWAHGAAPRNELEASERLESVFPVLERAFDRARFLSDSPWVLTNDTRFRRREGDFEVHASHAMGDHPDFEHVTFVSTRPLAEDVFYLRTGGDFLDMTPLVVMRQCPTCHQREVAYADRLDAREGVSLKTFDRGHVLFDPGLVDELRTVGSSGDEAPGAESA